MFLKERIEAALARLVTAINAVDTKVPVRSVKKLGTAHSNSTITSTTVTDGTNAWSQAVTAGKSYRFIVIATYQTAALTTGCRLSILPTTAVGTIQGTAFGAIVQAVNATGVEATLFAPATSTSVWPVGSNILTASVNPINSPHTLTMDFVYHCTTTGTLAIQFASKVAASAAQLNVGSTLIVETIL